MGGPPPCSVRHLFLSGVVSCPTVGGAVLHVLRREPDGATQFRDSMPPSVRATARLCLAAGCSRRCLHCLYRVSWPWQVARRRSIRAHEVLAGCDQMSLRREEKG